MEIREVLLSKKDIPRRWYNVIADLPFTIPPPIDPTTKKPAILDERNSVFCKELLNQEISAERWIDIPEPVRQAWSIWRPTPLRRAKNLEKYLKTKARIYYKDESTAPAGSFKQNTAMAQAYYFKKEGYERLITETGAGQWGSALSFACSYFSLKCRVYMVSLSYQLKPYRRYLMRVWGAEVISSPSEYTNIGRKMKRKISNTSGSLGIAASEAIEEAFTKRSTRYAASSLFNFVNLHQSVIGIETKKQCKLIGERPDYLIGCVGGGSNFAGLIFPFLKEKLKGEKIRFLAVEPSLCPSLTKGAYLYDFTDAGRYSNLQKMYTLGHSFVPPPIHITGLRYHGCSPVISLLYHKKLIEAIAYPQLEVLKAGVLLAKTEGILPAVEATHAVRAAIDIAKSTKKSVCIVFNLSGHGYFDLNTYEIFLDKKLRNYRYPVSKIRKALKELRELQP